MIARIPKLATISAKPVLLTEWGFDMARNTPTTAALWFQAQLPLMAGESFFYTWRDYGTERYGLVDGNNVPRQPLYNVVRSAVRGS